MVLNASAAYLHEENKQEIAAVKVIAGRRGFLRTLALTAATGAIGLVSAGPKPAAAAVEGDVPIAVELRRADVAGMNVTRPS
jgi:hypothetical protein